MEIVAIVPLDKRRSRVLTDEELTFVLYRGELRKYEVEEGGQLPSSVYDQILREVLFKRAKERCLYLLKARDRTEQEIRRKLREGFYPEAAIDYAVEFLKEYRFVDDENYGRNYIRVYGSRKSRKQIEFELREKGLDREDIGRLLEEQPVDEREQILKHLRKKGYEKGVTPPKERARIAASLARKGFSFDEIYGAMEEYPDS